jgi:hypothetical protein
MVWLSKKCPGHEDSEASPCYLMPIFATCQVVCVPCDLCHNFPSSSAFFIFYPDPFLPTRCRCRKLLLYFITVSDTHTHTHTIGPLWMRDRPAAETSARQRTTFKTDRHQFPGGIRTRSLNKRIAADPRLKPLSHRDRLSSSSSNKIENSAILLG